MTCRPLIFNPSLARSEFSFERKLDPSDATFSAGRWEQREHRSSWHPIHVDQREVRHTQFSSSADQRVPTKLHSSIDRWTLIDTASLPDHADTLKISFTLRVAGNLGSPVSCTHRFYRDRLKAIVDSYNARFGFHELALRYVNNLVNARFTRRNRLSADAMEVHIRRLDKDSMDPVVFDAFAYSLHQFTRDEAVDTVAAHISTTIASRDYASFEVSAYARIGANREVFPSQELILDKGDWRSRKNRTAHAVRGTAGVHAAKIGNAIRTIDTWYSNDDNAYPIPVEPYGRIGQHEGPSLPHKRDLDLQSLLETWLLGDDELEVEQQHYVMANLIRGGIFGSVTK